MMGHENNSSCKCLTGSYTAAAPTDSRQTCIACSASAPLGGAHTSSRKLLLLTSAVAAAEKLCTSTVPRDNSSLKRLIKSRTQQDMAQHTCRAAASIYVVMYLNKSKPVLIQLHSVLIAAMAKEH